MKSDGKAVPPLVDFSVGWNLQAGRDDARTPYRSVESPRRNDFPRKSQYWNSLVICYGFPHIYSFQHDDCRFSALVMKLFMCHLVFHGQCPIKHQVCPCVHQPFTLLAPEWSTLLQSKKIKAGHVNAFFVVFLSVPQLHTRMKRVLFWKFPSEGQVGQLERLRLP